MGLHATDLGDLDLGTLRDLGRMKLTDLMSSLQHHKTIKAMTAPGRIKTFGGGKEFQFNLQYQTSGTARSVGLGYTAVTNIRDTTAQGNHPFRHGTFNYSFEDRELLFNRGGAEIFDVLDTRRRSAFADWVEHEELKVWRCPASSDVDSPHGIPYWVVKNNTVGFNGGAPSGYTTVGGINPSTGVGGKWKNYSGQYTAITEADLVDKMETAMDLTKFEPLTDQGPSDYNTGDKYVLFCNQATRQGFKRIAKSFNDSLGFDLDPAAGKVMFRRVGIEWIAKLDEDTTNPVYGINFGVFKTAVLKGDWMHETKIDKNPLQPRMKSVHVDCTRNYYTYDRRRHFVLATDTTMPS